MEAQETYEYAGFEYQVRRLRVPGGPDGILMVPVPGQHEAANKEKHRMAARECYLQDQKRKA